MHHEDHEGNKSVEYWSGGVLECWVSKMPLLHNSSTPLLRFVTFLRNLRVLRVILRKFALPKRSPHPGPLPQGGRGKTHRKLPRPFRWERVGVRATLSSMTALFLSGCMIGPDYQRPSVEIPAQFRAAMTPDTAASIADLKWFEVFKDEYLQELIRVALVQNYDLRDAIARVDAARANLGITRSNQFPQFGVGGDATSRELSRQGEFTIPQGTNRQRTYGEVFLSLFSFEIDIWGRLRRATESAQAQLLAEDWNRKTVITTLISDVATAYFNLLELDMEIAIARKTLGTREESLRLLKIQLQGGVGTLLDVRQGEQLVYTAAEVIPDDERQIQQTENQISFLLGKNPGLVARASLMTAEQTPPEVPPGLTSKLLERRPDIQAAEQTLVAANANIGVAKAAYFPTITLTGEFGFQSTALSNLFAGSRRMWNFIPQITQPIFTAGRIRSQVKIGC